MSLELLALSSSFGFAVGLVAWMMLLSLREVQEEAEETFETYSESPLFKAALPFIQYMARRIENLRSVGRFRKALRTRLMYSGKSLAISADEFMAWMMVWGGIGVVVAGYFKFMIPEYIQWPMMVSLVLLCAFIPYIQLGDVIKKRQKEIRKILPYVLDLLCLAVEAGLDFSAALNRIGENLKKNPFRDELRILTQDLTMGKTRPEALRDMERRIGIEELTSVVSSLVQADELGASLGPALRIQSSEMQRIRFQRAEKKALQAPVLMLIPLVIFIFPLVFFIIFTPIGLKIYETMGK